ALVPRPDQGAPGDPARAPGAPRRQPGIGGRRSRELLRLRANIGRTADAGGAELRRRGARARPAWVRPRAGPRLDAPGTARPDRAGVVPAARQRRLRHFAGLSSIMTDLPGRFVMVVMGVSGSGKTTIGKLLAGRLGWQYAEADDFHSPANVAKMAAGHP